MDRSSIDSLRNFYERHRQEIFTYALSFLRCRDSAEDVIHHVFLRLLKKEKLPVELRPYIFRSIRNAAIDHSRSAKRIVPNESIYDLSDGHHPQKDIERKALVEQLLESLSDEERECILLKTYGSFTFKEIGEIMDVSINTAASWHRRGIEKMRTAMEEDER